MQAMDHAVGAHREPLHHRARAANGVIEPARVVEQVVRGIVRDDEKRVLASADDDDREPHHQGIGPISQGERDGGGENDDVLRHCGARAPRRAAGEALHKLFRQRLAVVVLEFFAVNGLAHLSRPPSRRYFTSRNSSIPYFEPSRPRPECFTPPNGATSVEMMPTLAPTMPVSISSATLKMRPTSRL